MQPIYDFFNDDGKADIAKTYLIAATSTIGTSLIDVEIAFKILVLAATACYTIFKCFNEWQKWNKNRKCKKCDED